MNNHAHELLESPEYFACERVELPPQDHIIWSLECPACLIHLHASLATAAADQYDVLGVAYYMTPEQLVVYLHERGILVPRGGRE